MNLSQKMIRYRAKNDLTQEALARIVGVSCSTIISAEKGKRMSRLVEEKIKLVVERSARNDVI